MGVPSIYTAELADEICRRIASGESVRRICQSEDMPSEFCVYQWVNIDREGFAKKYAEARRAQAEKLADELLDIADDGTNDYVERARQDGSTEVVFDGEHYQRSRLRVDTRKWYLSKVLPKVYGDKQEIEHSGDPAFLARLDASRERARKA